MNSHLGMQERVVAASQACIETWCAALRSRDYRITETRRQLVMLILRAEIPMTANSLFEQAKMNDLKLGMATIYRTLELLEELGLMQRLHDGKGCHGYMLADRQSLLAICQSCGQIDVWQDVQLQELLTSLPAQRGYQVNEISVQVRGLCANCR